MDLIDANVILRYLLRDIEDQYLIASQVVDKGCCTTTEVLAEVVYVLTKVYKVSRLDVASALFSLLKQVQVENGIAILYGITLFRDTNLDFVDCLLISYNNVLGKYVVSFDKKLNSYLAQLGHSYGLQVVFMAKRMLSATR